MLLVNVIFNLLDLSCSTSINTGNSKDSFPTVQCSSDDSAKLWTKNYDPSFNPVNNKCSGYVFVPAFVACNVTAPNGLKRLCNCVTKGLHFLLD